MKFLLDQNLSAGAADVLRKRGMDVIHARDAGLATAEDDEILEWSRRHGHVVITLDADFHVLLALSEARSPSVIRIRIEGLRDLELSDLIERVVGVVAEDLARGVAVTVTPTSVRRRNLPLAAL